VKKVAFQAILSLLHKELADGNKTGSLSHTYASNPIAFLSGSDEDFSGDTPETPNPMLAKTPSPFCLCFALGNHLITRLYVLKHCQEQQTKRLQGPTVSRLPDDNQLPDAFYAHEWCIDLLHQDNVSYQINNTRDSLYPVNLPLSVGSWVNNHCQHQDTSKGQCHQRTQDNLSWEQDFYRHLRHRGYLMSLTWLFFNSSTLSRLSVYNGSGEVTLSLPRFHEIPIFFSIMLIAERVSCMSRYCEQ